MLDITQEIIDYMCAETSSMEEVGEVLKELNAWYTSYKYKKDYDDAKAAFTSAAKNYMQILSLATDTPPAAGFIDGTIKKMLAEMEGVKPTKTKENSPDEVKLAEFLSKLMK